LRQWQALAREPRLIEAAIWFHNAIYRTPELHAAWEAAARANLVAELSDLA